MALTPEEQATLDALNAKAKQTDAPKDTDINNMSDADVRKMTGDAIDQKRAANAEAKALRLKLDKFEKEKADAQKKIDDENKTATEKLTAIEAENARLTANNASIKLQSQAKTDLLSKGYKPEAVNNAVQLTGLTDENYSENIKSFETVFKDFKGDTKPGNPAMGRVPNRKIEPKEPDKQSRTARIYQEMLDNGGNQRS